jgi:hypothetical protein
LERGFPNSFARPEFQLGVQVNQTTNNTLVITAEVANELERRNALIEKELEEVMRAHEAKRSLPREGTNGSQIREVEAELMSSGTITLPPPISRHSNWWASLSRGDGNRRITVEAATFIIKTIAVDALGPRAVGLKIDLDNGDQTLRDVWDALESLCGPSGWQALTRRGEE